MKKIGLVSLILILIAACSPNSGNEFVGKWVNTKNRYHGMEIVKNGDNFIVNVISPSLNPAKQFDSQPFPATLKDGVLQFNTGFSTLTYVVDKNNGLLKGGGNEYKKITPPAASSARYEIRDDDKFLRFSVARWAADSGYTFRWEHSRDWPISPGKSANGFDINVDLAKTAGLKDAVDVLLGSFQGAFSKKIKACLYDQEKLLVIRAVDGPDCSVKVQISAPSATAKKE